MHRIGYRSDAPALAAASEVVALTTTIPEGLPRSVLEAMCRSRPCIVTNIGGQAELVVDGETGLTVPIGNPVAIADAIVRLQRDPMSRARMGRAAHERVAKHFHIRQTIASTLALYAELANRGTI